MWRFSHSPKTRGPRTGCFRLFYDDILPIRESVKFKVACLIRQSTFDQTPLYLMIAASCPTALGALVWSVCSHLRGAANTQQTAIELLQPLNLACWTLLRSSWANQTSPTDCSDDSWRDTFCGNHEHGALWLLICGAYTYLLTYLLTYKGRYLRN